MPFWPSVRLFILGFFLARWLEEKAFFGAERVIVSSASSKAAAALAHELGRRAETIGLTSAHNLSAVVNARISAGRSPTLPSRTTKIWPNVPRYMWTSPAIRRSRSA